MTIPAEVLQQCHGVTALLDSIDSGSFEFKKLCIDTRERLLEAISAQNQPAIRRQFMIGWALATAHLFAELEVDHQDKRTVFMAFAESLNDLLARHAGEAGDVELRDSIRVLLKDMRQPMDDFGETLPGGQSG